jgi:hypothetical protein
MAEDVRIPRILYVANMIRDEEDKLFLQKELGREPVAFFPDAASIRAAERAEAAVSRVEDSLDGAPEALLAAIFAQ